MSSLRDEINWRKPWLDEWPGHVSLVEPSLGSTAGIPDAHLVAQRFPPGWVEFKALDHEGAFKLEPSQRLWGKDFVRYSNRCAYVVLDPKGFQTFSLRDILLLDRAL